MREYLEFGNGQEGWIVWREGVNFVMEHEGAFFPCYSGEQEGDFCFLHEGEDNESSSTLAGALASLFQ